MAADDRQRPRKLVIGEVRDLPNERAARARLQALNININLDLSEGAPPPRSFSELVDHYHQKELEHENERKAYSTRECYKHYLTTWIVPRWGSYTLAQIENGIAVHVGEDVKTAQALLRHANPSITMSIYTHAVSAKKRAAQTRVVEMVLPEARKTPPFVAATEGSAHS